ncbi:MAG: insulinase family protein [Prevotella sp.]|nr:insulinase family protein [Prevotella sp.]
MTRISFKTALLLTLTLLCSIAGRAEVNDPINLQTYTLDNGLKVFISVNKEQPRITAHVAVNTGSRNDPAETTGLAHYLEHLMFKGSKLFGTSNYAAEEPLLNKISDLYEEYRQLTDPAQRKAKYHEIDSVSQLAAQYNIPNEYDKMMSAIGSIGTNAFTSYDVTCYVENIPANELERWCMIQSDRFQNLVMRGFHTELEAVYEEKNITMTKDSRKSSEALLKMLFPTHPYGMQTTIGTQEHLKNPSQVNIRNYYNRYYVPNNIAICMAGDLDPEKTIAMIKKYFGGWKPAGNVTPPTFPAQPVLTTPKDTTVLGQETEHVRMAWRLKGASSLQNDTITMVDMLLSNGKVGLMDVDLDQKMAVMGAGTGIWDLKDHSMFVMEGRPNEGQTLDEVKALLLAEVEKLKRGEWDEKLIHSIAANERLAQLTSFDSNDSRVDQMVDCYITGTPWLQHVGQIDRIDKLTKDEITAWAREHLNDGYVCVYKRKGEDTTIVKIEKPAITPIPSNRDIQSDFLKNYINKEVEPIHPQFVDYEKDMTVKALAGKNAGELLYKKNEQDDRFSMQFRYEFGSDADRRYGTAGSYFELIGTKKETLDQIKRRFYDIACNYSFAVGDRNMTFNISGLQENMPRALKMLDELVMGQKADTAVYNKYVEQVQKGRAEVRTNQNSCYNALVAYGMYGEDTPMKDVMSVSQLKETAPEVFTQMVKDLWSMPATVLYWGPATADEVAKEVKKVRGARVQKFKGTMPVNKVRTKKATMQDEVFIAPYDAKNINMRMIHNENLPLDIDNLPTVKMFNEYFGGSMNAIVFQELRESRALAYNAWATYVSPSRKEDTEYYQEHIISQTDKLADCIKVFKLITDTMPESPTLFATAQQSLLKNLAAARTTRMGVLGSYLNARYLGIDYDVNRLLYEKIPTLKLQDLVRFEQQYIKGKPLRYLILGKEDELLESDALKGFGTVHRLTLDDIFPE